MVGGHLQRTGYSHGVLAIAALSALVAAMYTQSSFIHPLSETMYNDLPVLSDAYVKPHQFATTIIALSAIACALTALMSLVIDWHVAIRTPAYMEFTWVGLAWSAELASVILAAISSPYRDVCSLEKSSLGIYNGLVITGKELCSNWTAVFITSVMSLIMFTFHLTWHIGFRLWHRAALSRRPTSPIDFWNTPLPRHYPINPHETQQKDNTVSLALNERDIKPEDSVIRSPSEFDFIIEQASDRVAREDVRGSNIPVVKVFAPIEDQGTLCGRTTVSESTPHVPPGLEKELEDQHSRSPSN
ncbi:transmembrane protein, putative [Rhizoctonia solani AG-3 Rhs1AP]|uniref:Transmembrane protein, putative n=1 Tax=Rhizoctonia solani AG-3 Rhs1AP TaxID=1086054 RepID=X8JLT4_9AGAM|nr:transmembrane protein, putative [Rhizoctonia solani AG-3 Rhs1AP]